MLRPDRDAVAFRHEIARVAIEEALPPDRRLALHRRALAALERRGDRPGPARPSRRRGGRRRGGPALRPRRGRARRAARRAPRGGGAVRPRAAPRGRRSAPTARAPRVRVLPHRRDRGGDRGPPRGAGGAPPPRRPPARGRRAPLALAAGLVRRRQRRPPRPRRGARSSCSSRWRPAASWRWPTATWRSCGCSATTPRRARVGRARDRARRAARRDRDPRARAQQRRRGRADARPAAPAKLERSLALAAEAGLEEHVARAYTNLASVRIKRASYALGDAHLQAGIAYCRERDLDAWLLYMLGWQARSQLEQGDWDAAARSAGEVLDRPGRRRADADHAADRDRPAACAARRPRRRGGRSTRPPSSRARPESCSGSCRWRAPAPRRAGWPASPSSVGGGDRRGARAGAGTRQRVGSRRAAHVAQARRAPRSAGGRAADPERRGSGRVDARLSLRGGARAAGPWRRGSAARAPGRAAAARRPPRPPRRPRALRERGVRGVRRGPRATTRANPAGLTARELEVLELVAEGLRNAEIAERLVLAPRPSTITSPRSCASSGCAPAPRRLPRRAGSGSSTIRASRDGRSSAARYSASITRACADARPVPPEPRRWAALDGAAELLEFARVRIDASRARPAHR